MFSIDNFEAKASSSLYLLEALGIVLFCFYCLFCRICRFCKVASLMGDSLFWQPVTLSFFVALCITVFVLFCGKKILSVQAGFRTQSVIRIVAFLSFILVEPLLH